MINAAAASAAWGVDRLVGEPPAHVHPVALFGATMTHLEQRLYSPTRWRGAGYTAIGVAVGASLGFATRQLLGPVLGVAAAATGCMAGKMLEGESRAVASLLASNRLDDARQRIGGLVGRRTDQLTETDVCRAAIESLAENTVDAVTATMFWATFGGAVGAVTHRCINTMDAMVGHRNERFNEFGWASARLDDAANWIPARLTAVAVLIAAPHRATAIVKAVRRDAPQHPSPNGGVIEAAVAAALDIKLGGTNTYGDVVDDRGELGTGTAPTVADIERAVHLTRKVAVASLAVNAAASYTLIRLRVWRRLHGVSSGASRHR